MTEIECPKCSAKLKIEEEQKSLTCPNCNTEIAIVMTEKELADAISKDKDYIYIEGDLSKKTVKIKAAGKVAWAVAIGAITVAVIATIAALATGGTSEIIGLGAAGAAITVLGVGATTAAIYISVSAGGVWILKKLRNEYKIINYQDNLLILKKK